MNTNGGGPNNGMKRRLPPQDPRQRMNQHQSRFPQGGPRMQGGGGRFQGGGRGPGPGSPPFGRGGGGGRGFHQQGGPGMGGASCRGPMPPGRAPPMIAGRGPMMHDRGPGGMGMGVHQPMMHAGRHTQMMQMQRGPFPPPGPGMTNINPNRMGQVPPPPSGMRFGQTHMGGRGAPPPPPPRQAYPPQQQHFHHQQQPPHLRSLAGPLVQGAMVLPPGPTHQQQYRPPAHPYMHHPTQYRPINNVPPQVVVQPITTQGAAYSMNPQQPQQTNLLATSPKNVSAPYTQTQIDQIDQAWTEHTNSGVKYYHNSISQSSTYEKPKALLQQQTQQDKPSTAKGKTPWAEYADAKTGKQYYSDGVTTTWEKPEGYASPLAIIARSKEAAASVSASSEPAKKKRKKNEKETPLQSNEEPVDAFKGLLLAQGVSPAHKWNEVVKMCSSDSRWDDCEAVLTTGERKQAMAEYQTKRANELRTQERHERARAKDAYIQLLTESLPKQSTFSSTSSRFSEIRDTISKDDRFYAVVDEKTRERLFLDFCEELRKQEERKKRDKKREAQDAFCTFLKEKEEAGTLSFSSTWNSFVATLVASDKDDNRFTASSTRTESDRQLYFADFVIALHTAEDDKRKRIHDARRRAEKAQRDAYRNALEKLGSEGKITPASHWRDVERLVRSDSSFLSVKEHDGDAPREMFEEFSDEWDDMYGRDRQFLSQLVHPSSNREILVAVDTQYDEFAKALLEEANSSPQLHAEARRITETDEPLSSARLYYNELVQRAKEKHVVPLRRRGHGARRGSLHGDSSSEDEGEIIEVEDKPTKKQTDHEEAGPFVTDETTGVDAPAIADAATATVANAS